MELVTTAAGAIVTLLTYIAALFGKKKGEAADEGAVVVYETSTGEAEVAASVTESGVEEAEVVVSDELEETVTGKARADVGVNGIFIDGTAGGYKAEQEVTAPDGSFTKFFLERVATSIGTCSMFVYVNQVQVDLESFDTSESEIGKAQVSFVKWVGNGPGDYEVTMKIAYQTDDDEFDFGKEFGPFVIHVTGGE